MKKKNIILCAGVLSLTMMCGCGENTQNETSANVTTEVTQEVTETVDTPETTDTIIADDETKTTTESNTVDEYDSEQPEIQEENTETADTNVDLSRFNGKKLVKKNIVSIANKKNICYNINANAFKL